MQQGSTMHQPSAPLILAFDLSL